MMIAFLSSWAAEICKNEPTQKPAGAAATLILPTVLVSLVLWHQLLSELVHLCQLVIQTDSWFM